MPGADAASVGAAVARTNLSRAGLGAIVDVRTVPAIASLPRIAAEGLGPFDLVFIDADKRGNPEYLAWAMKLTRRGSQIIIDNVVRDGAVIDPSSADASVQGVRAAVDLLSAEPRVRATAIQTVGCTGYDGFILAVVTAD